MDKCGEVKHGKRNIWKIYEHMMKHGGSTLCVCCHFMIVEVLRTYMNILMKEGGFDWFDCFDCFDWFGSLNSTNESVF